MTDASGRSERGAADACLARLYEEHQRTVVGICRMLLRDPVEAEDACQQVFLSAYRSLLTGNRPEHPAAWLATIARNECWHRVQQRMRQPMPQQVPDDLASRLPGPVEVAARNADLTALVAAIGALPPQQRDALLMREFAGLSYAELAATLSVSEPAVESLLVRARRELRLQLQPLYAAGVSPFLLLRGWLDRLGAGSDPALGTVAKMGAVPLAAKLAAGVTVAALVGGVTVGGDGLRGRSVAATLDPSAAIGVSDAAAGVRSGPAGVVAAPDRWSPGRSGTNASESGQAGRRSGKVGGGGSSSEPAGAALVEPEGPVGRDEPDDDLGDTASPPNSSPGDSSSLGDDGRGDGSSGSTDETDDRGEAAGGSDDRSELGKDGDDVRETGEDGEDDPETGEDAGDGDDAGDMEDLDGNDDGEDEAEDESSDTPDEPDDRDP